MPNLPSRYLDFDALKLTAVQEALIRKHLDSLCAMTEKAAPDHDGGIALLAALVNFACVGLATGLMTGKLSSERALILGAAINKVLPKTP